MDNSLKEYKTIRETFKSVAISAMEYQHQDGLFKWSLLAHKGPVDTSASAMILYAMALGINLGIIDPCYRGAVKKGYNAFEPYIKDGKVTQAMGDCRGFAMYPQFEYGPYPWSNAFFLLLDSEIRNWGEYKS